MVPPPNQNNVAACNQMVPPPNQNTVAACNQMVPPPHQNIVAVCNHTPFSSLTISFPGRFPFLTSLMPLYKSLVFLYYLTVSCKFINFSFQIFLRFVPEMSATFTPYTVQIICISLVCILCPLHFSLLQ